MSQQTTFLTLGCLTKRTRADRFLDEMNRVVPWGELAAVVAPHYQSAGTGRPLTEAELLLRLHCLQLWYNLSDPGLEDAVHDRLSFQRFLGLDPLNQRVPDETTVLNFRRLLESHQLSERIFAKVNEGLAAQGLLVKTGTVVDATILSAPSSTKNRDGKRDPEMSSTQKNGDWHFGMKAHIGVDAKSGLVHTVKTTTASVHDSQVFTELTHGEETVIAGDSAYANQMLKADCRQAGLIYLIHDKGTRAKPLSTRQRHRNRQKSSLRSKVEFPSASSNVSGATPASATAAWRRTPPGCICSSLSPTSTKLVAPCSPPPEPGAAAPTHRQITQNHPKNDAHPLSSPLRLLSKTRRAHCPGITERFSEAP